LHRFERDPAGLWFHHVGQHVHTSGGFVHHADLALAASIETELARLDGLPIAHIIARHADTAAPGRAGLHPPRAIVLLYSRAGVGPVARLELGNAAADGANLYARVRESDLMATIPDDAARRIDRLIELAGGPS